MQQLLRISKRVSQKRTERHRIDVRIRVRVRMRMRMDLRERLGVRSGSSRDAHVLIYENMTIFQKLANPVGQVSYCAFNTFWYLVTLANEAARNFHHL